MVYCSLRFYSIFRFIQQGISIDFKFLCLIFGNFLLQWQKATYFAQNQTNQGYQYCQKEEQDLFISSQSRFNFSSMDQQKNCPYMDIVDFLDQTNCKRETISLVKMVNYVSRVNQPSNKQFIQFMSFYIIYLSFGLPFKSANLETSKSLYGNKFEIFEESTLQNQMVRSKFFTIISSSSLFKLSKYLKNKTRTFFIIIQCMIYLLAKILKLSSADDQQYFFKYVQPFISSFIINNKQLIQKKLKTIKSQHKPQLKNYQLLSIHLELLFYYLMFYNPQIFSLFTINKDKVQLTKKDALFRTTSSYAIKNSLTLFQQNLSNTKLKLIDQHNIPYRGFRKSQVSYKKDRNKCTSTSEKIMNLKFLFQMHQVSNHQQKDKVCQDMILKLLSANKIKDKKNQTEKIIKFDHQKGSNKTIKEYIVQQHRLKSYHLLKDANQHLKERLSLKQYRDDQSNKQNPDKQYNLRDKTRKQRTICHRKQHQKQTFDNNIKNVAGWNNFQEISIHDLLMN